MNAQTHPSFGPHLKKYFDNRSLSDAVIRCGGREFAVHRLVLCSHSEYFAKQLDGPWKESYERAIEIADFDVSFAEAMIYFLYHFEYDIPNGSSAMIVNAKMYQIADKYGISTLKTYAQSRFNISIEKDWKDIEFSSAIELVYTSTPPSDRTLRDAVVITSLKRLDALTKRDDFNAELASNADFAIDNIRFQRERFRSIQCYTCWGCSRIFDIGKPVDKQKDGTACAYQPKAVNCPICHGELRLSGEVDYNGSP